MSEYLIMIMGVLAAGAVYGLGYCMGLLYGRRAWNRLIQMGKIPRPRK